ncbi:AtpZ/AtpI family protein [Candidatus Uhrbacteria bacterium]|nr:AtpZ/AtpI family protein [Candidatus Uhrbacteria bacterium]
MAQDAKYYRLAGRIFADFSGTIAIPAVLAALLGKWLDGRYGTEPRYMVILLVVAFALSAYAVVRKAKMYKNAYERLMNEPK